MSGDGNLVRDAAAAQRGWGPVDRESGCAEARETGRAAIADGELIALFRLLEVPGLGPVRTSRLVQRFGSAIAATRASLAALEAVPGIGPVTARRARERLSAASSQTDAHAMLRRLRDEGISVLVRGQPGYPALLEPLPDAPMLLMIRGSLVGTPGEPAMGPGAARDISSGAWGYGAGVGIVGSRACSLYGLEQSRRFAVGLSTAGLTIVSGGARGIDTAAHRAALDAGGRTVVVVGCGLGRVYPPENADLFDRIVASGRGAIVSELPYDAAPSAENFPARNRIISGLSLGVLVIEAGRASGALITARLAAEEHGREVLALPGRVDSPSSEGCHELIAGGGAQLVTSPAGVVAAVESQIHHLQRGTHTARYLSAAGGSGFGRAESVGWAGDAGAAEMADARTPDSTTGGAVAFTAADGRVLRTGDPEALVLEALRPGAGRTVLCADQLVERCGLEIQVLRRVLTLLELTGRVVRVGTGFERARDRA